MRASRRVLHNQSYEMAVLTGLLKKWGGCLQKFYDFSGLPTSDILYKVVFGHQGKGTGIPIPDCPTVIVQLSNRINQLSDWNQAVLTAKFAMNLSPTGYYSESEKAAFLGLSVFEFRKDVGAAKRLLLLSYDSL